MFLTSTLLFLVAVKMLENKTSKCLDFQFDGVSVSVLLFTRASNHHKSMVLALHNRTPKYRKQKLTESKGETQFNGNT